MEEIPYQAAAVMAPLVASDYSGMVYEVIAIAGVISLSLGLATAVVLCLVYWKLWPLLLTPALAAGWALVIAAAAAIGALRPFY